MNFLLSRNVGFDTQSGYLTIFEIENEMPWDGLQYILTTQNKFFKKLLTLTSLKRVWTNPSSIIDIKRKALVSDIRIFVRRRFITRKFFRNRFFKVFYSYRYSTNP